MKKITMIQKVIVDLTDDVENDTEDLVEVMVENKVSECEKRKVKNELYFEKDGCLEKKMSPSTPSVAQSRFHRIIDISDDDDDANYNEIPKVNCSRKCDDLAKSQRSSMNNIHKTNSEHIDEEHIAEFNFNSSNGRSAKRKRATKIITSDDDDVSDNQIPKVNRSINCDDLAKSRRNSMYNIHKTNSEHIDEEHIKEFKFNSSNGRSAKRKRATKIITSDDEDDDVSDNQIPKVNRSINCDDLAKSRRPSLYNIQKTNSEHINEEHIEEFKFHSSDSRSAKRKRATKIITSDDEDSYDAPKTQHSSRVWIDSDEEVENSNTRRLKRLTKLESRNKQDEISIDLNNTLDLSEDEEEEYNDDVDGSENEDETLGGFIVHSSESVSIYDSESGDSIQDPEEDIMSEYKATMEEIGRKKVTNFIWNYEGEMLSDFAKYPELCMRAACALYRKQTADEKEAKVTRHQNEQGFNQPDAPRGSKLAEFLLDGDPDGDIKKTVEELEAYDPSGIKLCRRLGIKYSKQLFKIYQSKEDPNFLPDDFEPNKLAED